MNEVKELTELKNEFYEVMYKYEKSFSEEGVMANLTAWQTAKADLLSLLRRHPSWNEDEQAIIFDCNQALSIQPDMVDETAFTLLDIASEILSGEQLEDFRTALHAAVSGYSCTVSEENLEILRQRGGIRCAKDQKASRIIGKLCKKYGVDSSGKVFLVCVGKNEAQPLQNMQKRAYPLYLSSLRLRCRLAFSAVTVSVMIFTSSSLQSATRSESQLFRTGRALRISMHSTSAGSQFRIFIICTSSFVLGIVMPVSIWLICVDPTSVIAASCSCVMFFRMRASLSRAPINA